MNGCSWDKLCQRLALGDRRVMLQLLERSLRRQPFARIPSQTRPIREWQPQGGEERHERQREVLDRGEWLVDAHHDLEFSREAINEDDCTAECIGAGEIRIGVVDDRSSRQLGALMLAPVIRRPL